MPFDPSPYGLKLVIRLPKNRWKPGTASLEVTSPLIWGIPGPTFTLAGPFEVYGKADNSTAIRNRNPTRDPRYPFGDTPLGGYQAYFVPTGRGTKYCVKKYGPSGALVLEPMSGNARKAAENGRLGLMIHGGDLSAAGKLRATNGCIRISNEDMEALQVALKNYDRMEISTRVETGLGRLSVEIKGVEDTGFDEGDPIKAVLSSIRDIHEEAKQEQLRRERLEREERERAERQSAEREREAEEERRRQAEREREAEEERRRQAEREQRAIEDALDREAEEERRRQAEREQRATEDPPAQNPPAPAPDPPIPDPGLPPGWKP